ncbi:MAG TPA: zinc-binding alcohol dehydrogenase [Polyangiaceae bacterium]|nr:zinc-binding alcohol dehydrogenase [Polyangiaceae bacterium]
MSDPHPPSELPDEARALWLTGPCAAELRREKLAPPKAGEVLVRTLYSAISRGTESLVFAGRVPESEYARMRCPYQSGEFPFPVKYGYASVGTVLRGSPELEGRAVFCLFPHQSAYVVPESAVIPLPDGVPPERAVLAANLETALNAIWDAELRLGDRVSIVGAGVVGCSCAFLAAQVPGAEVELIDMRASRAEIAARFGASFALPPQAARERDLVFHASGSAGGLRTALELAARDARIIELSWFGNVDVSLPLGQDFHARRLTLRSSQVGTPSPQARARWTTRTRLELALSLCKDPRLSALIGAECSFDALPSALNTILGPESGILCQRVRYV